MLTLRVAAAALLATSTLPGLAASVDGAFGHAFGRPVSALQVIGPAPPAAQDPAAASDVPAHLEPRWLRLEPAAVPRVFDGRDVTLHAHLGEDDAPIQLFARIAGACTSTFADVAGILSAKYPELAVEAPSPEQRGRRFGDERRFGDARSTVDVRCVDDDLVLDYVDLDASTRWRAWQAAGLAAWEESRRQEERAEIERQAQAAREAAAAREAEARSARRRRIEGVIGGDGERMDGVFGVPLREPYGDVAGFVPDVPLPLQRDTGLPRPFDRAHLEIVLDPAAMLVSARARLEYANPVEARRDMDDLALALRERYGPAMKDRPQHRIFNVAGDYVVLKHTEPTVVEFAVIQQTRLREQRVRERQALAEADAQRRRHWEQETKGL